MMHRSLNFLPRTRNLKLLQTSALMAVLGCVTLGSALLFQSRDGETASIADTLASPTFSAAPTPATLRKPKAVSENEVVSVANDSASDTIRYYEQDSGKAFSLSLGTQRTTILSDKRLPGFLFSLWIPNSQRVISAFQRPTGTEYQLYDYSDQTSLTLGSGIKSLSAAPDGRHIAWLKKNSDDSYSIVVASPDGSNQIERLGTRAEDATLSWRTNDELVFITHRADRAGYDLSLLPTTGVLDIVLTNKENLETAWSPDGQYILYSYFAPDIGVSLWLRSIASGQEVALGVLTSAHKCSWHSLTLAITCGVPMRKSLSRDISADRTATVDDIYTYNFDDNTTHLIYSGQSSALIGVTKPLVSSSGKYFVFTNMFDSRLYSLPLD